MLDAWENDMGVPYNDNGGAGSNGNILGITWKPISVDGVNITRCSARKAYYDPAAGRPNLDILVNHYVSKVHTLNKTATGVEIISRANAATKKSVNANKEVILAAGALHTPQILQLSGIGPAELLQSLNIPVVQDLPGVGANFQDHPTVRFTITCKPIMSYVKCLC